MQSEMLPVLILPQQVGMRWERLPVLILPWQAGRQGWALNKKLQVRLRWLQPGMKWLLGHRRPHTKPDLFHKFFHCSLTPLR